MPRERPPAGDRPVVAADRRSGSFSSDRQEAVDTARPPPRDGGMAPRNSGSTSSGRKRTGAREAAYARGSPRRGGRRSTSGSGSSSGRPGCRLSNSRVLSAPSRWTSRAFWTSCVALRNSPLCRETTTSGVQRPGVIPSTRKGRGSRSGSRSVEVDVGVDPLDEGGDDRRPPGVVVGEFARHVAAEAQQPGADVARRGRRGPRISAIVPVACRRQSSSWNRRSRAALNPWAKNRSCSVRA